MHDNPSESRYEVHSGDTLAGFTQYKLSPGRIAFIHTETDPAFAGKGLAHRLVTDALDDVRSRDLAVLPFCPYVKKYLTKNPEYLDLVPAEQRERFGL
ncbi:N-acetyltransferase [Streptomyces sp. HNM0574]|nr:N-acetyltransferase [Streptomyces sp. HNM0574]